MRLAVELSNTQASGGNEVVRCAILVSSADSESDGEKSGKHCRPKAILGLRLFLIRIGSKAAKGSDYSWP